MRFRHAGSVFLIASLVPACAEHASPKATATSESAATTISVDPVMVVEKKLDVTLELPGELSPFDQVEIYPRANGFVRTLKVDRGSRVKKGDLLVRLEAPELASQRAEADARVSGDKSTLERLQAAQKQTPGAVAEHDVELAEASVRASRAKAASFRALERYLVVTAPFDGIITEREISEGALVGPPAGGKGTPMLKMESVSRLRLTVAVPEDQTSAVTPGDVLDFGVRAWPERVFKGTVTRVAHAVEVKTRTMPVELDVDNSDGALSSGMFATVKWHARRPAPTLFVPASAVVQGTEKTFVVRIKDAKAEQVEVERGVPMQGLLEVFGKLSVGDVVAKRGSEELRTGTSVTVRVAAPAPSASGAK